MDINALKERLDLLTATNTVSHRSARLTVEAYNRLLEKFKKDSIDGSEMLFTHLPMAITRIERGEDINGPVPEIMAEVKQADCLDEVMQEVNYIESLHGQPLPPEEIDYLMLHYTTVFLQHKKGE